MDEKAGARERLDRAGSKLIELSHRIHANPELGYEERLASAWLCGALDEAGFAVDKGVCGIETAFVANAGSGPLHVGICAEYDSLPGIGHACGHNLIAAMAVGAAIAAKAVADDIGLRVTVFGTPGEELGDSGGKILLLERGAFAGVHAAMMVHPAPIDVVEPPMIANSAMEIHYFGREAHASAMPEQGINALDALTVAQTAIGLLRQHMAVGGRVHGIVTKGGDAPNIVPAHTSARYMVRSPTIDELQELKARVTKCFEAGALATGATLRIEGGERPYAEMVHDHEIAAVYRRNAESLGRFFPEVPGMERFAASTDMGNVSRVIPSIHPAIGIDSLPAVNHQPAFAAHCATPAADKALIDGALAMAWATIDLANDPKLRERLLAAR